MVSVAMCVFNGSEFLAEQLNSLANQNLLPNQLVICDDGSTDGSLDTITEFQKYAPFQVVLHRNAETLGPRRNFQKAISLTSDNSEFIALSDQDDVWYPNKIKRMVFELKARPNNGYVFSDATIVGENTTHVRHRSFWDILQFTSAMQKKFVLNKGIDVLMGGNVVQGASLMFRSTLKRLIVPFPELWKYDEWIPFALETRGFPGYPIAEVLMAYRQHNHNALGIPKRGLMVGPIRIDRTLSPVDSRYECFVGVLEHKIKSVQLSSTVSSDILDMANRRLDHLKTRQRLHSLRCSTRTRLVLRELLKLNYFRFSEGLTDIVLDFLP